MGAQVAVALLIGFSSALLVSCNTEGDVLYAQKQAWKDRNNVLQSWDPTLPNPCTWFHISCSNNNSVIRVDLGNAGLSGPLVPQLGGLKNLQYLELFGNDLTGVIPSELGNLSSLVSLELQNNLLSGPIPSSLGFITTLQDLQLHDNNLTGSIPPTLGNLKNLVSLGLHHNLLSGDIPATLGNITTLQFLRLNGNTLSGMVPMEILSLAFVGNLTELNVANNNLTGTVGSSSLRVTVIVQDKLKTTS